MKSSFYDQLSVEIYENRRLMGQAAAQDIRQTMLQLLVQKETINVIFAAAPSQNEVLAALADDPTIPWDRINAFHMDEYVGLPETAPQGFANFLKAHLFNKVNFRSINCLNSESADPQAECHRYAALLVANPADMVVLGIGENGHIAFNDPGVADFHDPATVKIVVLDAICRQQQVNDGCFSCIDAVPTHAMTLTVPTLVKSPYLFCIVPGPTKAKAVQQTLCGPVSEHCPASILRRCEGAKLYLDVNSGALL